MSTNKPNLNRIWANEANPANIIDPDVGEPGKFDSGWLAELPPFEYFNFLQQLFTQGLAHNNEQGINVWDTDTVYPKDAWAKGSDGEVYVALSQQSGNNPVSSPTKWKPLASKFISTPKQMKRKVFTSSTSFSIPAGVDNIFISVHAAGGGGGGGDDGNTGGAGNVGQNASNSVLTYLTNTITSNGGKGGQNVGLASYPTIDTPQAGGGSVSGPKISNIVISVGNGSGGGIGGAGQTLAPSSESINQGGTGGTGSSGGLVKCDLDTSSGGSLSVTIGSAGTGGTGNSSNSNNDGGAGNPAFIEIIYFD